MATDSIREPGGWAEHLLSEWDRQQALHRPHREDGMAVLAGATRALLDGRTGTVVELGCGCGSVLARLRSHLPDTHLVGVDRDPVLLRIATEVFRNDREIRIVDGDFRDLASLSPVDNADIVVSCTTLHWLGEPDLKSVYRAAYRLLAPGGALINLDWMPAGEGQLYKRTAAAQLTNWLKEAESEGALSWRQWWSLASRQPELQNEIQARSASDFERPAEFMPDIGCHENLLIEAGFSEVAEIWRAFDSAAVLALRR